MKKFMMFVVAMAMLLSFNNNVFAYEILERDATNYLTDFEKIERFYFEHFKAIKDFKNLDLFFPKIKEACKEFCAEKDKEKAFLYHSIWRAIYDDFHATFSAKYEMRQNNSFEDSTKAQDFIELLKEYDPIKYYNYKKWTLSFSPYLFKYGVLIYK